jgi:hypothetical protein
MRGHLNSSSVALPVKDVSLFTSEEALVCDARAGMTPAQMVEQKLLALLKGGPLLVSQTQSCSDLFPRER